MIGSNGRPLRHVGELPIGLTSGVFGHDALVAGSPVGITAGDATSYEYRQYSPDGRLRRIVRTADTIRTASPADIQAIIARRLGNAPASAPARRMPPSDDAAPRTPIPAYSRLQVDDAGRVWLAETGSVAGVWTSAENWESRQRGRWAVFDSTGILLGVADPFDSPALPDGWKLLMQWNAEEAVFTYRDDDGAPHVATLRYRISQRLREPAAP